MGVRPPGRQLAGRRASALVVAACLFLTACATAPRTDVEDSYFRDLGEVTPRSLSRAVDTVLVEGRDFEMARREVRYARAYYETEWRNREPFSDEAASGVTEARSRVVIRGQRASGGVYRVVLEGENEIRTDSIPSWHTAPVGGEFREWMGAIESDLREETRP